MGYVYAPDKIVEVEKVMIRENPKTEDNLSSNETSTKFDSAGMKIYESDDQTFRFSYPSQLTVSATTTSLLETPWGTSTITYPGGSIDVPGLFIVSRIPYLKFSKENAILDYDSACCGRRFWFDESKNIWSAEEMLLREANETKQPIKPFPLSVNGACSLVQVFGKNTFYQIKSGDEGMPTEHYYFLMTDKGYAIRFTTPFDLEGDYSSYADSAKPDPKMIREAKQVLSSVALSEDVPAISPTCL